MSEWDKFDKWYNKDHMTCRLHCKGLSWEVWQAATASDLKLAGYWDDEYQKFVEKVVGDELLNLEHYRIKLIPLYYKA